MPRNQSFDIAQTLQEMRADYWRNLESETRDETLAGSEYLVVQIGPRRCALPAGLCNEVLKLPRLVRVPRLPAHFRGIFNLRGEIIAVTDLGSLFDQAVQDTSSASRLVVVAVDPIKTALLVSRVEGLERIDPAQVEPLADGVAERWRDLFAGKRVEGDASLMIIDLESVLGRPELLVDQTLQDV